MPASKVNLGAISYETASDESRDVQRLGYHDVAERLPFRVDYDRWEEPVQRDYEIGRFLAWMVRAHGVEPVWRSDERAGQMLRRLLGHANGTACVHEINNYIQRDAKK